ncbi:MAG: hypothetical protein EBZ48_07080 [Proteobacteria bacterium]|nr:hypothetical protein [Pseudomonadota bacterium]
MALITNAHHPQTAYDLLNSLGIERYFRTVCALAEFGYRKPSRRIFEYVLEREGVRRDMAVHIGDSYDDDVVGARDAGIDAVHIPDIRAIREVLL